MKNVILTLLLLAGLTAPARTLTVGRGQAYTSIRKAVTEAQDGDTVLVRPGFYYLNNAVVRNSITILGEGMPVLHGADKYELFTVSARHVKIAGFHLVRPGYSAMNDFAAIKVVDAAHVYIENNRITGAYFGIHLANTEYCVVRNNNLNGLTKTEQTTGNGIHLWKSHHAVVEGNTIRGHRDGIYFEFVTESLIRNNLSENNIRYGLHFMFSNNDRYFGNRFRNNGAGVAVMYSHKVHMQRNRFEQNWGPSAYGILLKEISDSRIERNEFFHNTVGILMEGSSRIRVQENTFRENGWAARVQASCNENAFTRNNFLGNTFDMATNGSLVLNTFSANYWDKYEGYDLNKDGRGDIPYHPVSMYSMIIEQNPNSLLLLRSFSVSLLDKAEKAIPSLTPIDLADPAPFIKKLKL
ncbi:MAG TPA: nitrous oxide reductase family maturation protein NosD [Chitinophagaceae bacterium]|jgi:nitrous oxidase accessory protein|nr:nitrous oxide reductase family maturation protein NosD [Chitinophagaceae bacterium]